MTGLSVKGLKKSYWHLGQEISVLESISLDVFEGKSLSIVGQSGAGKSTFLHCLGLIDSFDAGEIYLGTELVARGGAGSTSADLAVQRRKSIGFVFQFHFLMPELSALENVMVPLLLSRLERAEAVKRSEAILSDVGLSHRLTHRTAELSGGEQQRVAIARALVHRPKVILADEPTGNLDPKTADSVFNVLKDQTLRLKAILIMATHNLDLAKRLDDQKALIGGRLQ